MGIIYALIGALVVFLACATNGQLCSINFNPALVEDLLASKETVVELNLTCAQPMIAQHNPAQSGIIPAQPLIEKHNGTQSRNSLNETTGYSVMGYGVRPTVVAMTLISEDPNIAKVKEDNVIRLTEAETVNITIQGIRLGRTKLIITSMNKSGPFNMTTPEPYTVLVIRKRGWIDLIFGISLGTIILVQNFGFGCKIELKEIKEILKKPVAPAIGFCCQFLIMPPLSVAMAHLLQLDTVMSIGLLAIGSSAGGGASNVFCYILEADLNLSMTMTFISTIAALGMTPLWMWILGRLYMDDTRVNIPAQNAIISVAAVVVPVVIGVIVNHFKPRVGAIIVKLLRPWVVLFIIVFLALLPVAFRFSFSFVTWRIVLATFLTPLVGFILGAVIALIFKQPLKQIITISLETGMQNMQLSVVMIGISLPQPESDMATTVPIMYMLIGIMPWTVPVTVKITQFLIRYAKKLIYGDKDGDQDNTVAHNKTCDDQEMNGIQTKTTHAEVTETLIGNK
ncbi:unnamed protein product [Owenia fusiformis]|uniref:Uncharacterized protein n=1 Tax=Owenia fusiformis TaxID=6347 RepID=A0A8J1TT59_OWEFU|nr:unnamed protein product [Owenia fusiformis]